MTKMVAARKNTRLWPLVGRVVLVLFGLGTGIVAFKAITVELEIEPVRRVAERIIDAENFSLENLSPLLVYLDRKEAELTCDKGVEHIATIRLYAAASGDKDKPDETRELLRKSRASIRRALSCSPHDAFLWYSLFWVEMTRGVPLHEYIRYLETSYALAPNEAWLGRFRSSDALALYDQLNSELQAKIRSEYLHLVRDNPSVAVAALRQLDANSRATAAQLLGELPLEKREQFAKQVDAANLLVDIPGVDYRELYHPAPPGGRKRPGT